MCMYVCVQALLANFANLGSRRIRYPAICIRFVYSTCTFLRRRGGILWDTDVGSRQKKQGGG